MGETIVLSHRWTEHESAYSLADRCEHSLKWAPLSDRHARPHWHKAPRRPWEEASSDMQITFVSPQSVVCLGCSVRRSRRLTNHDGEARRPGTFELVDAMVSDGSELQRHINFKMEDLDEIKVCSIETSAFDERHLVVAPRMSVEPRYGHQARGTEELVYGGGARMTDEAMHQARNRATDELVHQGGARLTDEAMFQIRNRATDELDHASNVGRSSMQAVDEIKQDDGIRRNTTSLPESEIWGDYDYLCPHGDCLGSDHRCTSAACFAGVMERPGYFRNKTHYSKHIFDSHYSIHRNRRKYDAMFWLGSKNNQIVDEACEIFTFICPHESCSSNTDRFTSIDLLRNHLANIHPSWLYEHLPTEE